METIRVEFPQSKIIRDLLHDITRRAAQGLEVYGHPIDEDPMSTLQALKEMNEELADACVYCGKAIANSVEYDSLLSARLAAIRSKVVDLCLAVQTEIVDIQIKGSNHE